MSVPRDDLERRRRMAAEAPEPGSDFDETPFSFGVGDGRNLAETDDAAGSTPRWKDPVPFGETTRPEFPAGLLIPWQRRFVEEVSRETETMPDLAAMLVLSVTSLCCARRVDILQRPGFRQPLNLWTCTMLASGNRKTAVFNRATEPIRNFEAQEAERLAEQIAVEHSQRRRLEAQLKRAEKAAAEPKATATQDERKMARADADQLARDLAAFQVTRAPRFFMSEATPERLEELLMEQGGRIGVLADENGLIDTLAGRYSKAAPNLTTLLSTFDGGDVRVGRMKGEDGRGGDRIQKHALTTLGLAPQPEGVMRAFQGNESFGERGFAWRFLFSMPKDLLGHRTHDKPAADQDVLDTYSLHLGDLMKLPDSGEDLCPAIEPVPEATDLLLAFERDLEAKLRPDGDLAGLRSWGSKLTSRVARIAGVLHCAANVNQPWIVPLEVETMERAVALSPYLIAHAKAMVAAMGADGSVDAARRALAWLRRDKVQTFTRRDLHRAVRLGKAGDWDEPLEMMEDSGHIAEVPAPRKSAGRKPSPTYMVSPRWNRAA